VHPKSRTGYPPRCVQIPEYILLETIHSFSVVVVVDVDDNDAVDAVSHRLGWMNLSTASVATLIVKEEAVKEMSIWWWMLYGHWHYWRSPHSVVVV
jgi:hypothetical protein